MANRSAIAIAAHPDDIEFVMGGTLMLLKQAGYDIHYMNVANGSCGSTTMDANQTRIVRAREGQAAAQILGATFHSSLCNDLEVVYSVELLRKLAAVIREVQPEIVLTHSPEDYMEDHMNVSRLAVTAAFSRGMSNFATDPPSPAIEGDVALYHAMPHGLCDGLRRPVDADFYIDTSSVHATKRKALAAHKSQKEWLDASQGLDSYLITMDELSEQVGERSQKFKHAEGWRRHLHWGLSSQDNDPLAEILGDHYLAKAR
ncbi:MAG: PIG-L family deacetylase [Verrucomicrobiales bacterium]|nr:PIG-L family deacetylase [Verrucomicrobiales bacterium]